MSSGEDPKNCVICRESLAIPTRITAFDKVCKKVVIRHSCFETKRVCNYCAIQLLQLNKPKSERFIELDGARNHWVKCPLCNDQDTRVQYSNLTKANAIEVDKFAMQLLEYQVGCEACGGDTSFTQEELWEHILNECHETITKCKACSFTSTRAKVDHHYEHECLKRTWECCLCRETTVYINRKVHTSECIKWYEELIKNVKIEMDDGD